jgi:hypothetical protein
VGGEKLENKIIIPLTRGKGNEISGLWIMSKRLPLGINSVTMHKSGASRQTPINKRISTEIKNITL